MKRIILAIALALPLCLQAQQHHELGISLGVANYYGDLQSNLFPTYGYKPMAGIVYKYFMSPHVGIRMGISYASITAADSLSDIPANKARNLSFATNIIEGHIALELNLLPIDIDRMKVTPYVFGGLAVFYFNPYAMDPAGDKVFLKPLSTEGQGLAAYPDRKQYNNVQLAFPIGGGLKFFIGKTFIITPEIGFRYTNTDYLDDVSKSYVNLDTLMAHKSKLATQMSFRGDQRPGFDKVYPDYKFQRGDSKTNDWYWFGNITITVYLKAFGNMKDYILGRCPVFYK
ncbi:MAG: outer membrane beta-barrel protein [Taibaiella sp.]|nr:outer membrane beta-barrel protein [Taibaiella sp.]